MISLYEVRSLIGPRVARALSPRFPRLWDGLHRAFWGALRLRHPFVEIEGVRIRVARALPISVRQVLYHHLYETLEIGVLRSTLEPQDVVMELGTGLGFLATYAAKRIGSERVFTYEANPALKPFIDDTFALNRVSPTSTFCLLGERAGESGFFSATDFRASSTVRMGGGGTALRVPVRPIDDELRRIRPTFLVIDIEGGEYDLIRFMSLDGVRKVLIEVHDDVLGPAKIEEIKATVIAAGLALDATFSTAACLFFTRTDAGSPTA